MQHANALTFAALLPAVRPSMRLTRFLVITQDTISERFYLYGSTSSNEDALAASKAEHPFTLLVQEIEYLSPEAIEALRAANPLPDARIERLGRIPAPSAPSALAPSAPLTPASPP